MVPQNPDDEENPLEIVHSTSGADSIKPNKTTSISAVSEHDVNNSLTQVATSKQLVSPNIDHNGSEIHITQTESKISINRETPAI
tara:strand:- start:85 stop:339 length:255 start_codon:yes stop_codon:yes gene_type:complete